MDTIRLAADADAASLWDLTRKQLTETGFAKGNCEEKNRDKLIAWIAAHCEQGAMFLIERDKLPVCLALFKAAESEIVFVVTADGMERQGLATAMINYFQTAHASLTAQPVTRGGTALLKRTGFVEGKSNIWSWRAESEQALLTQEVKT